MHQVPHRVGRISRRLRPYPPTNPRETLKIQLCKKQKDTQTKRNKWKTRRSPLTQARVPDINSAWRFARSRKTVVFSARCTVTSLRNNRS